MDIQEKAEQYAREIWGVYYDEVIPYGMDQTYGEIAKQDFIAGYNEAKRWIPVGELLPEIYVGGNINAVLCKNGVGFPFVGRYTGKNNEFYVIGTSVSKHATEWREI